MERKVTHLGKNYEMFPNVYERSFIVSVLPVMKALSHMYKQQLVTNMYRLILPAIRAFDASLSLVR